MAVSSFRIYSHGQSVVELLMDLRFSYAVVSSGLILLGFFWNNLAGFTQEYLVLIVAVFCANVFMFVVNDFYDADHDLKDSAKRERNVFCSTESEKTGRTVLYASLGLSLFLSALVSLPVFVIIVLFDLLAFFYSAPPIKLRNRAYWDWIFVFLWKGLIIAASYVYFFGTSLSAMNPFMYGTLSIILLMSWIGQLDNQIRDFEVDRISETNHSTQRLGYANSLLLRKGLLVVFFLFSVIFCLLSSLYVTLVLVLTNCSLYYFVSPQKHRFVLEIASIWVVILFLEHFVEHFSYYQQMLFAGWVVIMGGLAVHHVKRYNLFENDLDSQV